MKRKILGVPLHRKLFDEIRNAEFVGVVNKARVRNPVARRKGDLSRFRSD